MDELFMTTILKYSLIIVTTINQAYFYDDSNSTVTAITLHNLYHLWFPSI